MKKQRDDLTQMRAKQVMEIANWRDSPRPRLRRSQPRALRRWPPTAIGILGTLLLHASLVSPALLGDRAHHPRPPEVQEPGTLAKSRADAAPNLLLITLPTISSANQPSEQETSSLPAISKLARVLPTPEPPALLDIESLPLDEDHASAASVESRDGSEQARLLGIYRGQIQARINRIWRRPRTPVDDGDGEGASRADKSFQCRAQIVQDAGGNVQEILLLRCNGSTAWQHSLVTAIGQASPLPAPPSTTVFSPYITLDFLGLSYAPGVAEDDYESAPIQVAQTQNGGWRPAKLVDKH
jgi:hypothetical protein